MSFISAVVALFVVMDPVGNIPLFLALLEDLNMGKRVLIVVRELVIALAILLVFLFSGRTLLDILGISQPSLSVAGGVILFLVSLRMIFSSDSEDIVGKTEGEPFIVPLAVPSVAGPSAIATVLLFMARAPSRWMEWVGALVLAWSAASVVLIIAVLIGTRIGRRGINALKRLMGMLLTTVAVEMFLTGLADADLLTCSPAWSLLVKVYV